MTVIMLIQREFTGAVEMAFGLWLALAVLAAYAKEAVVHASIYTSQKRTLYSHCGP
jgi:hypothetical protein